MVNEKTGEDMRYLYRLNAEKGSGKKRQRFRAIASAARPAPRKRWSTAATRSDKRFNAFVAAFPMDNPQYIVLTIIDEPKPEKPGMGATAGSNAAPMVANIIRRSASMLGVKPNSAMKAELRWFPISDSRRRAGNARRLFCDELDLDETERTSPVSCLSTAASLPTLEVTGVTSDSRQVEPGVDLCRAHRLKADGAAYAADAARRGAAAIVAAQRRRYWARRRAGA